MTGLHKFIYPNAERYSIHTTVYVIQKAMCIDDGCSVYVARRYNIVLWLW